MSEIAVEDAQGILFRDRIRAILDRNRNTFALLKKNEDLDYMDSRSV